MNPFVFLRRIRARLALVLTLTLAATALALSGAVSAQAAQCSASSAPTRTALLELYTSEGCDSCPPAENWLSQVGINTPHIVPLALHVDYWDTASWHDRYASPTFSTRQQALSERAGTHIVYTPEIAVAGYELRDWRNPEDFKAALAKITAQASGATIHLDLNDSGAQSIASASFSQTADASTGGAHAYLAVYENHLVSQIGGGENRGATLHHEFVVRQWFGPVALVDGRAQIHQPVNLAPDGGKPDPERFGIAAFVEAADGTILQATNLPACR